MQPYFLFCSPTLVTGGAVSPQPNSPVKAKSLSPTPSPTSFKMRNGSTTKKVVPNAYSSGKLT